VTGRLGVEVLVIKGRRRWVLAGAAAIVAVVGVAAGVIAIIKPVGGSAADSGSLSVSAPYVTGSTSVNDAATDSATSDSPQTSAKAAADPVAGEPAAAKVKAKAKTKAKTKPAPKAKSKAKPAAPATTVGSAGTGRIQFGHTYSGVATFYGATGAGNCSFEASSDLMVGAMNQQDYGNSQACGAFLAVTGPTGTTIKIRVVDRCPECPPGAIDLSAQAFAKLAAPSAGRIRITWHLLSPALSGPVSYKYKSGSSQYWCGIQVRNHRNPVRSLEVKSNGSWKTLARQDYDFFISDSGAGCGGAIRITDIYGNRLTDSGIRISPDTVQRGHAQFGPPK
jgi:expansin (peptidoglycan-binding protein)